MVTATTWTSSTHASLKDIQAYLEKVKLLFENNKTKDECKVASLLNIIGERTYVLLCDLTAHLRKPA